MNGVSDFLSEQVASIPFGMAFTFAFTASFTYLVGQSMPLESVVLGLGVMHADGQQTSIGRRIPTLRSVCYGSQLFLEERFCGCFSPLRCPGQ